MNELPKKQYFAILILTMVAAAAFAVTFLSGRASGVCHAPTEDSNIVDCDYRNGGWHK
jgi:hypothetical protein